MPDNQHLDKVPYSTVIESLRKQVDELKELVHSGNNKQTVPSTGANEEELKEQIKQLQIANEKAEYRIKILLRALDDRS